MAKKTAPNQRMWSLSPFVRAEFKEQMKNVNWRLFAEDWAKLVPKAPDGSTFVLPN
jgi:hypothetical protein